MKYSDKKIPFGFKGRHTYISLYMSTVLKTERIFYYSNAASTPIIPVIS